MPRSNYLGVTFPDRAESLEEAIFNRYQVFLDHWNSVALEFRNSFEAAALRSSTQCILVFGGQGSGKTLFARKMKNDFSSTRTSQDRAIVSSNLWHRITGGSPQIEEAIFRATQNSEVFHIEDDKEWVTKLTHWRTSNQGRHGIVIIDNAERTYFLQGLLGLDDNAYLSLGKSSEGVQLAAERFVSLARTSLRGCCFFGFTNNELFALEFEEKVNSQHNGLIKIVQLPIPSHRDKETIVRVNVNRLNPFSYWYCLDKAGPEAKERVREAILSQETYPGTFSSVDNAIKTAASQRLGRSAAKNTISLVVLHDQNDYITDSFSQTQEYFEDPYQKDYIEIFHIESGWAQGLLNDSRREKLLESEFNLRIILLGNKYVQLLLSDQNGERQYAKNVLEKLKVVHNPGTHLTTREGFWTEMNNLVTAAPPGNKDLSNFWALGQRRSVEYENVLRSFWADYNTTNQGFLQYRPDYVIRPYKACSVVPENGCNQDPINQQIRRDCSVFEFTAMKDRNWEKVKGYLRSKISNYASILEEQ